jgi:hypothetical protein
VLQDRLLIQRRLAKVVLRLLLPMQACPMWLLWKQVLPAALLT